ncbi:FKBP-type peptidyl-prolyl cis-trans isomerase [Marseilla massiliensis]|jgi:FKBP-type peptidyl-prolyl cis-trans isomerase FklB|uniref:FKBP-type peptidyl-prolyl cis-trans isomerase n=1 Tax=Marseilla massiliensis TaxID=1841864 RepID=UPI001F975A22|nr:FKBP-type peptidyl-prolyl cis-trans isomerase [Marseilla massiliensis]MCL1611283.1 FKBP-type peptidyl-prolyl cis-trans isomerase [Marseilla massiliensis]HIV85001.1 FKBP-type peptidyl-prolyl cis-trans isomerase [Candidatus Prevotella intestinigallinarum]
MKRRGFYFLAVALFAVFGLASCSEEDDTVEEFPNWQARNDAFFNSLTDSVLNLLELNPARTDWKRIKSWSKSDSIEGSNSDYIIVKVIEEGDPASATPLYTDTVTVHYLGRLLPSVSYPYGYVFDQSYYGNYYDDVSKPLQMAIGNSGGNMLVDGFATALQHMRRGDHWMVYIPYQLGYGSQSQTGVPAYSTLIFDLRLVDFWSPVVQ